MTIAEIAAVTTTVTSKATIYGSNETNNDNGSSSDSDSVIKSDNDSNSVTDSETVAVE